MQIKTQCWNEECARIMLIEDYQPGMVLPCPFCGKTFSPLPPAGDKLVLSQHGEEGTDPATREVDFGGQPPPPPVNRET